MAKTAVVRARIDESLLDRLDTLVASSIGDRSDHIRKALQEYLDSQPQRRHVTLEYRADGPSLSPVSESETPND